LVNNFEARRFGSQGQHRTIALAFKLAEIDLILSETEELPIILLDDVASELDFNRTTFLFNLLDRLNAQVFVTTTHSNNSCSLRSPTPSAYGLTLSKCTIFEVENGIINVSNT